MPNVAPDCTALCETGQRDCEAYLSEKTTRLVLRRGRDSRPVWGKSSFSRDETPDYRLEGPFVGSAPRRDALVASAWRDLLVRSAVQHWIIDSASAGMTSMPLQFFPSEGRACRVRCAITALPARISNSLNFFRFPVLCGCTKYLKLPMLRTNRIFRKCRNNFLGRCRTS